MSTFSAKGVSASIAVAPDRNLAITISGTFVQTIFLERQLGTNGWAKVMEFRSAVDMTVPVPAGTYRLNCATHTSGSSDYEIETTPRTLVEYSDSSGNVRFRVTADGVEMPAGAMEATATAAAAPDSVQTFAGDMSVPALGGSDDGADTAFLAGVMGNVIGDDPVTGEGNYLAGVIGAYSLPGNDSDYPSAALIGILMDGAADADAIVLAHIDGSDPSASTRATAAFGVRIANNHAGSGVDYGLNLYDDGARVNAHYSSTAKPFAVAKADIRMASGAVIMTGAGAPVNGTTGDNFAGTGSIYIDTTAGKAYINTGAITNPTWVVIGSQS